MHNSAFRKVWFSSNLKGIASATPTDLMHAYCHGVLDYVSKILLAPLNNQEKMRWTWLQSICFAIWKVTKNEYPHYMFTTGITNSTLFTVAEWVTVAFLLSMFTISSHGQQFWSNVNRRLQPIGESFKQWVWDPILDDDDDEWKE